MKKIYMKPQLYAERFEMLEHVASGCNAITGGELHSSASSCALTNSYGAKLFLSSTTGTDGSNPCDIEYEKDIGSNLLDFMNSFDLVCYNNAANTGTNMFSS